MEKRSGDGWTMYQCDFRDVIADIECDVVITDPPYLGASPSNDPTGGFTDGPRIQRGSPMQGARGRMMEYEPADDELLSDLVSLSRGEMLVLFNDFPGAARLFALAGESSHWKPSAQPVVWVRRNPMPTGALWRPVKSCEFIIVAARTNDKSSLPISRTLPGHYICAEVPKGSQHVIGQKPVPLMRALVRDYSRNGMTVFDPFTGSGTTGVAALQEGRKFVGCEMDPGRFEIACKRLSEPVNLNLFEGAA